MAKVMVDVQYASRAVGLPSAAQLRRWARAASLQDTRVTVRIVAAAEGRRLNRTFRGKDYATNVLTFIYAEQEPLSGDIVLCAPVVREEARAQAIALEAHYAHLLVHGMLHLQGFDHQRSRDARAMEKRETEIVARLGYPAPYAVQARPQRSVIRDDQATR
jgi:probable rRNA maturation factor